jgi:hypothetical protein
VPGHGPDEPVLINATTTRVISAGKVSYDMYATDGPASQAAVWILGLTQIYNNLGGASARTCSRRRMIIGPMMTDAIGNIGTTATRSCSRYSYPATCTSCSRSSSALDRRRARRSRSRCRRPQVPGRRHGPWNVRRLSTSSITAATGTLTNYYVPIFRHGY